MIKTCENCHKEWNAKKSVIRFCGTECYVESRRVKPKTCVRDGCDIEFIPERPQQKYCGHSCAAKVSNKESPKRKSMYPARYCFCGEKVSKGGLNHCSASHSWLYRIAYEVNDWMKGESSGSLESGKLRRTFRQFLVEMSGNKCSLCDWGIPNPVTGKPILSVDHIDGNWQNNSVDNLVVLCYNCHTLTETFGYLNARNELVVETRRSSKVGKSYGV